MPVDRGLAELFREPFARRAGIGHGFRGGEGLRGDDEQGFFGIGFGQHRIQMSAVDIGDKIKLKLAADIRPQSVDNQCWTKV